MYTNTLTNEIGTLKQLLPKISSPEQLTEAELSNLNIVEYVEPIILNLDKIKSNKLWEIENAMELEIKDGFLSSVGIKVDCDEQSINNYAQAFTLLEVTGGTSIDIINYDNVKQTISFENFKTMLIELGQNKIARIYKHRTLKDAVNAATTETEVNTINW